jgi:hypothetical protein
MYICAFSVFVLPCVSSGLEMDRSPVQEALPIVLKIHSFPINSEENRLDGIIRQQKNKDSKAYAQIAQTECTTA